MLKKLVAGALLTVSSLTGGLGSVSASTEKIIRFPLSNM